MNNDVIELEKRLGVQLPLDYREFLLLNEDSCLDNARVFKSPRTGVIEFIFTAKEIIENDDKNVIGIPDLSLLYIGSNILGGCLYLKMSDEEYGVIIYLENYTFKERFNSFSEFMNETTLEIV